MQITQESRARMWVRVQLTLAGSRAGLGLLKLPRICIRIQFFFFLGCLDLGLWFVPFETGYSDPDIEFKSRFNLSCLHL